MHYTVEQHSWVVLRRCVFNIYVSTPWGDVRAPHPLGLLLLCPTVQVILKRIAEEEGWPDMIKCHVLARAPRWVQSECHLYILTNIKCPAKTEWILFFLSWSNWMYDVLSVLVKLLLILMASTLRLRHNNWMLSYLSWSGWMNAVISVLVRLNE